MGSGETTNTEVTLLILCHCFKTVFDLGSKIQTYLIYKQIFLCFLFLFFFFLYSGNTIIHVTALPMQS